MSEEWISFSLTIATIRTTVLPDAGQRTDSHPIMARTTRSFSLDKSSIFPGRDMLDYAPRRLLIGLMLPQEPDNHYASVVTSDLAVSGSSTVVLDY